MYQSRVNSSATADIARYFDAASLPSQQATLGQIVVEILRSGRTLNRKSICTKLLARLDAATSEQEAQHYQTLIGMLFGSAQQ